MDGKCYLDGGISTNYPLNYCIESGNKKDEILGFKNNYDAVNESEETYNIDAESTMLDYISTFLHKLIFNMNTEHHQQSISHEVVYDTKYLSLSYLQSVLSSRDIRCELMASGKAAAEVFLLKKTPDT
jgi:predicted acylesterase/phospholipase RssA